jgi:hypothetical protein
VRFALVLLAGFAASDRLGAGAAGAAHIEQQALFVSDFLPFVRWPDDAFRDPGEELRVEIVGRDPFNGALDRALAGKTVAGHRVVVIHVSAPTLSPLPHVAFISPDEEPRTVTLLRAYCRKPVLTISDVDRFANRGGVIGLVEGGILELIEDDHAVHFTVNRTALYESRLQIGTERLYLAYPLFSAVSPCGASTGK